MAVYHGSRFEVEGTVLKNYNRLDLPASEYSRSVLRNGVKGSSDNYLLGDLDVVIPDGITEIGEFAFFCNYEIKSVTLPSSVKKIAENAFWCCRYLKVINFGGGIVEIGAYAFEGCEELEEIHLPQSLKTIGRSAFDCCGFKEVLIPEGVEIIDCNPFCGCKNLESIEVEEGNENFCAKQNCLIETRTKKLVAGCKNSIIPLDGRVEEIGEIAFFDCADLHKIVIPQSVKKIGRRPFVLCKNLTVYCQAVQPETEWDKLWNLKKGVFFKRRHKVVWGYNQS